MGPSSPERANCVRELAGADDHLLDAAHIVADAQPVIAHGIALSKINHVAFDNHVIGIDPDGRVHVSERLLMLHDGLLLEQSLKVIAAR
jgi:putative restriction endonuclease